MANQTNEFFGKANGAIQDLKNKAVSAEGQLEKFSHDAGEKIGEMATRFTDSTSDAIKSSRSYVQENPVKSLAIAAATGLVAGSLITMSMRRR